MKGPAGDPAIRVVLCDDVSEMRTLLRYALESDPRLQVVGEADNGRDGARVIAELQHSPIQRGRTFASRSYRPRSERVAAR